MREDRLSKVLLYMHDKGMIDKGKLVLSHGDDLQLQARLVEAEDLKEWVEDEEGNAVEALSVEAQETLSDLPTEEQLEELLIPALRYTQILEVTQNAEEEYWNCFRVIEGITPGMVKDYIFLLGPKKGKENAKHNEILEKAMVVLEKGQQKALKISVMGDPDKIEAETYNSSWDDQQEAL